MEDTFINTLVKIGFKDIEAKIYCICLKDEAVSGYSIALQIGVTRARIYQMLDLMLEKGYLMSVPGSPKRYKSVPIQTVLHSKELEEQNTIEQLKEGFSQLPIVDTGLDVLRQYSDYDGVITSVILCIKASTKTISLQIWEETYLLLEPHLREAAQRGVSVRLVISVSGNIPISCDFASELYYYDKFHSIQIQLGNHWIWMSADNSTGIFGVMDKSTPTNVVFTRNVPFIHHLTEFISTFFTYRDFVNDYGGADFLAVGSSDRFSIPEEYS